MASNCAFGGQLVGFDIAIKECTNVLKLQNIISMATQRLDELIAACEQHPQQTHAVSEGPSTTMDTHSTKRKWVESGTDDKKPRADTEQLDSALVTAGETAAAREATGHNKNSELRVVKDAGKILELENALIVANARADGFAAMYTQELKNTVGATLHASEVKLQVGRLATALKAAKDRIVVLEAVCASHSAHASTGADRIRQLQSDFDNVFMAKVLCETDLAKEKERANSGAATVIEYEKELSIARAKVSSLEEQLVVAHRNIESLEKNNADLAATFDTPEQSIDNGTIMQQPDASRPAPLRSVTYGSVTASRVHSGYNVSETVEGHPLSYKSAWEHERNCAEAEIMNSNRARNKRRRAAPKAQPAEQAEQSWVDLTMNPPPMPSTSSSASASTEAEAIDWDWTDVSVPTHIPGADNDMGGMVSFQEIDGVDCVWEQDAASGGRTLKFVKTAGTKKTKKSKGKQTAPKRKRAGPVINTTQYDSEDDAEDAFASAIDWDAFVAVDDFSEELAAEGKLVSIGSAMRAAETEPLEAIESADHPGEEDGDDNVNEDSDSESAMDVEDPDVDVSQWKVFGISPLLLRALKHLGFSQPTEIQAKTLHKAMNGRDIIGAAETGSGKTLAFGIPMLQHIAQRNGPWTAPTGLVLAPTRELAIQVKDHLYAMSRFLCARIVAIVGGMSQAKQERMLNSNPDIIVATPGRLWELVSTNDTYLAYLRSVSFLAVDEADRMLEPGHFKELKFIFKAINEVKLDKESMRRQTFVFSATLLKDMQLQKRQLSAKAAKRMQGKPAAGSMEDLVERVGFQDNRPHFVDVTRADATAQTLVEARIDCLANEKDNYLYYFLVRYPGRSLVFVNSIDTIRRMMPMLRLLRIEAFALHAQMEQRQRLKNIDRFRDTENAVLVASDVAARGLDIPLVDHVIHYQIPRSGDLYVHRSGRTARARQEGLAVMMVSPEERKLYYKMCAKLDKNIAPFPVDLDLVARLKPRVDLAKDIDSREHRINKLTHERNWVKKHAEELDIELDSDFMPSSDDERDSEIKHSQKSDKMQIKAARSRLNQLLAQKILGRGVSSRYLSSGIISDLAERLIDSKNSNETIPMLRKESALDAAKNKKLSAFI
ncbi:ATP-dependent RNA helicase [Coemansia interrupta]|uniref:ATP-dependent RNA helicase n=1 Tax=Coemansia interrupta TaxID=1126814 RepID=A0A9W8LJD1_9FUNG|nr:ATP-dependent RNA helicase [Coemansia interrupta]